MFMIRDMSHGKQGCDRVSPAGRLKPLNVAAKLECNEPNILRSNRVQPATSNSYEPQHKVDSGAR
jgi:hypothetical protein